MKYQDYNFKDFILDELFQQWVLDPDAQAGLFWEEWLLRHPEKQKEVTKAKGAILELHLAGLRKEQAYHQASPVIDTSLTAEDIQDSWKSIAATIGKPVVEQAPTKPETRVIPIFSYAGWARIAASILLLLAIGALFWLRQQPTPSGQQITFATAFGETKEVTLPDNSKVFLNANSRLTIPEPWPAAGNREVKLAGEAFFSVQHTRNHQRFTVSLLNGSTVEVLGTAFTVTDRPTLSRIVLRTGKVKVALGRQKHQPPAETIMTPGDLVRIDHTQGTLSKSKIAHPEQYAAFTKNVNEFNNTLLSEVARVLQDNYGYKVTFVPASLANKRLTSSTASNRVDLLLFAIEKSFNLKVIRKGKQLTIQTK